MKFPIFIRSAAAAALLVNTLAADAGVVAQWNMDNTFGTTMEDSSGNGNNGTMHDIVTSGGGYIFNGTSSWVSVPYSASLSPGNSDFSYTAQVQTDSIPPADEDVDIIREGAASTVGGGYRMEIENSKGKAVAYCSVSDNAGHTASIRGKTNIADNQLHTLTCWKTSTGVTLTVDALAPLTKAATLGAITDTKVLSIGCKAEKCKKPESDWYIGTMRSASISIGQ